MKKRIKGGKRPVAVLIAVVLILLSCITGIVAYAEYTKSSRAKRVLGSYEKSGVLFSSNRMRGFEGGVPPAGVNRSFLFASDNSTSVVENVTICNYAQGNPTKFCDQDIVYTLRARLVNIASDGTKTAMSASAVPAGIWAELEFNNNSAGKIILGDQTGSVGVSGSFPVSTLTRGVSSTDVCKVTFSTAFNTDSTGAALELYTDLFGTYTDIGNLSADMSTRIETQRNTWQGAFTDDETNSPDNYDGFNYLISGSGAGTFTLTWDTTKLSLNEQNLRRELPSLNAGSNIDGGSISFDVDSSVVSSYRLQFYRIGGTGFEEVWSTIKGDGQTSGYVRYSFTADS